MRRFAVFYFSVCVFALGCGTEPIGNVADLPVSGSGDDSSNVSGDGSFESAGSDASTVEGTDVDQSSSESSSNASMQSGDCVGRYCYVAPGTFLMGSPENELGRKQDEAQQAVEFTYGLYVAKHEVTQRDWFRVAEGREDWNATPAHFSECGLDCPIESINWWEALHYLNALSERDDLTPCYVFSSCNDVPVGEGRVCGAVALQDDRGHIIEDVTACDGYRLPTESEWEYAYRANTTTALYNGSLTQATCGMDPALDAIAWYCGNSDLSTHEVGQKLPNAWGLYDMAGNVFEWCWDNYGPFKSLRGGDWHFYAKGGRAAYRFGNSAEARTPHYGFRAVRTAW